MTAKAVKKIVVIEDEPAIRLLTVMVLKISGYEVESYEDGDVAFEALKERDDISLIITDVHMPEMEGCEFAKKLGAELKEKCPPIIFLTGDADFINDHTEDLIKYGVSWIIKPFSKDVLLAVIKDKLKN